MHLRVVILIEMIFVISSLRFHMKPISICKRITKLSSTNPQTQIIKSSFSSSQQPYATPLAHDMYRNELVGSPDAKLIVFLHGILGNKRNWRTPCTKWIQKHPDHQCIAVDHRGHGSSTQPYFIDRGMSPHTVHQCAQDLDQLITGHLDTSAEMICAHSFGGKVALAYLQSSIQANRSIPRHTWILDSLPGQYNKDEPGGQSVSKLFQILTELPRQFPSKEWIIQEVVSRGIDKSVALWLATNLISLEPEVNERGDLMLPKVGWGFDLDTIVDLFTDFCDADMWEFLDSYQGEGYIHFLRAGKNMAWTPQIVDRLNELSTRNSKIKLHLMPHVGHWLHVEDLNGMLNLIYKESNIL